MQTHPMNDNTKAVKAIWSCPSCGFANMTHPVGVVDGTEYHSCRGCRDSWARKTWKGTEGRFCLAVLAVSVLSMIGMAVVIAAAIKIYAFLVP